MVLDKKTVLKIWFILGSNLTFFRGTGPWRLAWPVFTMAKDSECYHLKRWLLYGGINNCNIIWAWALTKFCSCLVEVTHLSGDGYQ